MENIDHPDHYGGKHNPHEAIKVVEQWGLGFKVGNALKYIARAGKKRSLLEDLKKAEWYLKRVVDARDAKRKGHEAASIIRDERRTVLNMLIKLQGGRDPENLYSGYRVAESWELSVELSEAVIAIEKDELDKALKCVRNEIEIHQFEVSQ